MTYTLRDYQQPIAGELFDWFLENPDGHPIVSACVAAGKSIIIADFCKQVLEQWPDQRIVMLTATKELVAQNYEKLVSIWPEAPVGINCAGLGQKNRDAQIVFSTIQSIHRHAYDIEPFNIGIVDECHNINTDSKGIYRKFLAAQQQMNPTFRLIGMTGTPFRGNGVWLWEGKDPIFTGIASQVTMKDLLKRKFLSPLVVPETRLKADLSEVGTVAGDYNNRDIAAIVDVPEFVEGACDEIVELGRDRKCWMAFCANVDHANHVCAALVKRGIHAEVVTQETPVAERDRIFADHRAGRLRCLVNVIVATVGYDCPRVDLIALLRPTKSPVLYVQIAGRGMRLSPETGKTDCLWLDFSDATATLGPVDSVTGRSASRRKKGDTTAPVKVCDMCAHISPAGAAVCPNCGFEFPKPQLTHNTTASDARVLSCDRIPPEWVDVKRVDYRMHKKPGKVPSLKVTYRYGLGGMSAVSEWVCLEHNGMPRSKAVEWWQQRSNLSVPDTVGEALNWIEAAGIREPDCVLVDTNDKYPRVRNYGSGSADELNGKTGQDSAA